MTSLNGNIFRVTGPVCGEFTGHKGQWRRALRFSLICALNKWLRKQSWDWWFETPLHTLWRHCNGYGPAVISAIGQNCFGVEFIRYIVICTCDTQIQMLTVMIINWPLTRYAKLRVAHAPGMPGTFSPDAEFKGKRGLAIPACITARASRTCRVACRDCLPAVAGKTFPAFPAHAPPQFYVFGKRPM